MHHKLEKVKPEIRYQKQNKHWPIWNLRMCTRQRLNGNVSLR